jgi:hypothetical protein
MVRGIVLVALAAILISSSFGCALLESQMNSLKGSLIGVSYTAEFYDNYGANSLTVTGQNIDINGNKIAELGFDSSGDLITNYSLSSVLTITIDGKEMESCGDSIIFAESGLKKDVDFTLNNIESNSDGGWTSLTSVAKVINKYKNYFGKSRVVVIQSQLGVPICAYSGDEVYWEIPDDLPKMTKLMIDGKALYIHRVNFKIIDTALID